MTDIRPTCWIVGGEDGGHIVWEQRAADHGVRDGWTVIPLIRADQVPTIRAEERRRIAEIGLSNGHLTELQADWIESLGSDR